MQIFQIGITIFSQIIRLTSIANNKDAKTGQTTLGDTLILPLKIQKSKNFKYLIGQNLVEQN